MRSIARLLALLLCAAAAGASAAADQAAPAANSSPLQDPASEQILARLRAARPDITFGTPHPSALPGLYEVPVENVEGRPTLFVTPDGTRFIAGDLFAVGSSGFVNLGEQQRQVERRELIAAVKPEDTIEFAPANPKAVLTVFTDVDCGFCRRFHKEMPEINKLGIAVRYMAFPRAGLDSDSYRKIATAWCAADRQDALTRLKNGEKLPDNVCPNNPVAAQFALGEQVGVSGTPALVLPDGTLLPGYHTAAELAQLLGIN